MFRFEVNEREDFGADLVLEARKMLGILFSCIDIIFLVRFLVMIKLIMVCDWHKTDPKLNVYGYILA